MSDAGPTMYTCPRHKVETPLTCVTCQTPICPQCYVRTAVGLRCPKCAEGVTVKLKGGGPRWPLIAAAGVVVLSVIAVLVLSGGGGGGEDDLATSGPTTTVEGGPAPGYRLVSRPDLGFSLEVPMDWQEGAAGQNIAASYSVPRTNEASLKVAVGPNPATLADQASQLVTTLTNEGGREFVRTDTRLGSVPAIKINFLFPTTPQPGASLSTNTYYLAAHNGRSFLFQLATTDPGGRESVLNYMATRFTLL